MAEGKRNTWVQLCHPQQTDTTGHSPDCLPAGGWNPVRAHFLCFKMKRSVQKKAVLNPGLASGSIKSIPFSLLSCFHRPPPLHTYPRRWDLLYWCPPCTGWRTSDACCSNMMPTPFADWSCEGCEAPLLMLTRYTQTEAVVNPRLAHRKLVPDWGFMTFPHHPVKPQQSRWQWVSLFTLVLHWVSLMLCYSSPPTVAARSRHHVKVWSKLPL